MKQIKIREYFDKFLRLVLRRALEKIIRIKLISCSIFILVAPFCNGQDFETDEFLYGACVYPEIQSRAEWQQMLRYMAEADMNVVRVAESAWGLIQTSPNEFEFAWLDQFLQDAQAQQLTAILGTSIYVPPSWLIRQHPSLLRVEQNHAAYPLIKKSPAISDSAYQHHAMRYIRRIGERYRDHPHVIGWQLDNEIDLTLNSIYENPSEQRQWQQWLRKEFESPEALNERLQLKIFGLEAAGFEDVPIPKADYLKYISVGIEMNYWKFRRDQIFDFFQQQIQALGIDQSTQWVTTNWVSNWKALTDEPRARQLLDVSSMDVYHPSDIKPNHWKNVSFHFDLNRSVQNHQQFIVMETAIGISGNTAMDQFTDWAGGAMIQRDRFMMQNIFPAAFGAAGLLYWTGNRIRGSHAPYYGAVVGWDGEPALEYPWVKALGAFYKKWGKVLLQAPVRADVAVFTDYDQRLALETVEHITGSGRITVDLFDTFHRLGYGVDGINREQIKNPEKISQYPLLVLASSTILADTAVLSSLRQYVAQGGNVLVTPLCDFVTDDAIMTRQPGSHLKPLVGAQIVATRMFGGPTAHDYPLPQVRWTDYRGEPLGMELNGLAEFLEVDSGAQVLATFDSESTLLHDYPAVVRRKIQRGEVVKLAFWPEQNALSAWLSQWVPPSDPYIGKIAPPGSAPGAKERSQLLLDKHHASGTNGATAGQLYGPYCGPQLPGLHEPTTLRSAVATARKIMIETTHPTPLTYAY